MFYRNKLATEVGRRFCWSSADGRWRDNLDTQHASKLQSYNVATYMARSVRGLKFPAYKPFGPTSEKLG